MKSIFRVLIIILTSVGGFWGCQQSQKLISQRSKGPNSSTADTSHVNYTLIYMIHGDANYLYHNEDGQSLQADVQKLSEAIKVARRAKHGEVFIFHQRPEKKVLWLFPKKDRIFLHYRNGKLLHQDKYSPESANKSFVTEQNLFKKYQIKNSSRKFFLYFGHEIPQQQDLSYHHSRPDAKFDTAIFAQGIRSFLKEGDRFDLTVLSTCENGTPVMVSELQPITRYLLASPQNLHLSHIDTEALLQLEDNPMAPIAILANSVAQSTYDRLAIFIQTAITLSVYNTDAAANFLGRLSTSTHKKLLEKSEKENIDCAMLPFWDEKQASEGVAILYKPPSFGPKSHLQSYSGWGCQN